MDDLVRSVGGDPDSGRVDEGKEHEDSEILCHGTSHTALVANGPVDRDELVAGSQEMVRRLLAS